MNVQNDNITRRSRPADITINTRDSIAGHFVRKVVLSCVLARPLASHGAEAQSDERCSGASPRKMRKAQGRWAVLMAMTALIDTRSLSEDGNPQILLSVSEIMRWTELGRSQVYDAIESLCLRGVIKRVQVGGGRTPTTYELVHLPDRRPSRPPTQGAAVRPPEGVPSAVTDGRAPTHQAAAKSLSDRQPSTPADSHQVKEDEIRRSRAAAAAIARVGLDHVPGLAELPTATPLNVAAAKIEAGDRKGLMITLIRDPERISRASFRRAEQQLRHEHGAPLHTTPEPEGEVATPEQRRAAYELGKRGLAAARDATHFNRAG